MLRWPLAILGGFVGAVIGSIFATIIIAAFNDILTMLSLGYYFGLSLVAKAFIFFVLIASIVGGSYLGYKLVTRYIRTIK